MWNGYSQRLQEGRTGDRQSSITGLAQPVPTLVPASARELENSNMYGYSPPRRWDISLTWSHQRRQIAKFLRRKMPQSCNHQMWLCFVLPGRSKSQKGVARRRIWKKCLTFLSVVLPTDYTLTVLFWTDIGMTQYKGRVFMLIVALSYVYLYDVFMYGQT